MSGSVDQPSRNAITSDTIILGDALEELRKSVTPASVDLAIVDPPYFKVIGEKWDYQWRTEEDYLAWCKNWITALSSAMRLGGSVYLFGYFRMLARLLPLLENEGFKLRQQIVVNKGMQAVSGRATRNYKQYPNVTESILFLVKDPIPFSRSFLKGRQLELGLKAKTINEALGVKSNGGGMWSIYTGRNICEQLPTREQWTALSDILEFDLPYEKISITFNTEMGLTDVWDDIDFYGEKGRRVHPTQKPESLITRLVSVSSNVGDLVLDPFMGSGTTAVVAKRLGRHWIGFESDPSYHAKSMRRVDLTKQDQDATSGGTACALTPEQNKPRVAALF